MPKELKSLLGAAIVVSAEREKTTKEGFEDKYQGPL